MTTEQTYEPMTEAEVEALAAKTQAYWEQLTAKEQAVFHQFLRSASPEGDDVQGYTDLGEAVVLAVWKGNIIPLMSLAYNAAYSLNSTVMNAFSGPSGTPAPGGSSGGTLGRTTYQN